MRFNVITPMLLLEHLRQPFRYRGPAGERTGYRAIFRLTWPQMALLLCQFIIGITDVWAGGQIGSSVQASIGLITQCQMLLMALAIAGAGGAVASISQSLGAKRILRAQRYVGLVLGAGLVLGVTLGLVGYAFHAPFLAVIQTPPDIHDVALVFFVATLWSLPGHYGMNLGGAVFRAAKSVMPPLYVGMGACAVNVVGDLGFGLGWWGFPNYGAAGIAWSTCVAVTLGSIAFAVLLVRAGLLTRHSFPGWRWIRKGGGYLLKVAGPALGTSALWQTGYMVLFVITASLPFDRVDALAGLTAGLRVEALIFMPAVALNMTVSVLVGHSLGAGNEMEARRVALVIVTIGCIGMTLFGALLWPFRADLAALITPDPAVQLITIQYLTYNLLSAPFTVGSVVQAGALNGAGASVYPLMAFGSAVWLVRLPVAFVFGHLLWQNAEGVFLAMLVSQVVQASILAWVLRYRDWTKYAMRAGVGHH